MPRLIDRFNSAYRGLAPPTPTPCSASQLTINELSKFIEVKTNKQYVIVQKEFVKAISTQLFNNTLHIFEINKFLNEIWAKIVSTNQTTTDKWKEHLKVFED